MANHALRKTRDKLAAICLEVGRSLQDGGKISSASSDTQNWQQEQAPGAQVNLLGGAVKCWDSHGVLRGFCIKQFVDFLDQYTATLPEGTQTRIWGSFLNSIVCKQKFGISVQMAKWEHKDPVFALLGPYNEFSNFFVDLIEIAVDRLSNIKSQDALACIACCSASTVTYPGVKKALKIIRTLPPEVAQKAIDTAYQWHQDFKPNQFEVGERERVSREIAGRRQMLESIRETLAKVDSGSPPYS